MEENFIINTEAIYELSADELDNVTGGVSVKTGTDGNAGVWKKFEDIAAKKANFSLPNGTSVTVIGSPKYNDARKRNYVQIRFKAKGATQKGWIAASIVGKKR